MKTATSTRHLPVYRVAYAFSTLGNPLLTSTLILGAGCVRLLSRTHAMEVLAALVFFVIVPIAIWNGSRVRSGRYSDFDVSRREDRTTMYPIVVIPTLLSATALFATHQPVALSAGMTCVGVMTAVAALTNRWIKISLHAAFSFFYAIACAVLSVAWVAPLVVFAILVAISRYILKRHTLVELALGAALGILTGVILISTPGVL